MGTISLDRVIADLASAGRQLTELQAAEGSAGNLSVAVANEIIVPASFPEQRIIGLPVATTALAGSWIVITASGSRLRDIETSPEKNLCILRVEEDGQSAMIHSAEYAKPTSEWNSHLTIQASFLKESSSGYHAVAHAQPLYLTYLSHLDRYASTEKMTKALIRWQPETILVLPEGIGVLPFAAPGSQKQMELTGPAMLSYKCLVWRKHGAVARSSVNTSHAADIIEYAEVAAWYEYSNLVAGDIASGLSADELQSVCTSYNIQSPFLGGA